MLRPLSLTVAVMALAAFATEAAAQSEPFERTGPQQDWTVDVGVGAIYSQDAGGDTGGKANVIPYISANWRDQIYFSPFEGLGWNILKTESFRAGVQLRPRFGPDDIEGLTLERPDFGADAAVYAYQRLPGNIVVGGRVSRDVTGVSDGTEYQVSVAHQRWTPLGGLNASAYVRGGDQKLADAYYGVSSAEAVTNAISAYTPDGGLQGAGATLLLISPLGRNWAVGGLVNYERRLGDIADSPLSRNDDSWRVGTFVSRRFGG